MRLLAVALGEIVMATEFARDPRAAARAAERVRSSAQAVIQMSGGRWRPFLKENGACRLNVVAVVGPGAVAGTLVPEAVLLEIGVFRGRPYRRGHPNPVRRKAEHTLTVTARQRCLLDRGAYESFAPTLFRLLRVIAERRAKNWQSFSRGFARRVSHDYYLRSRNQLCSRLRYAQVDRGVRFSVSLADQCVVNDIYWAELNLNRELSRRLTGLAGFIGVVLGRYDRSWRGRKSFKRLKGVQIVLGRLKEVRLPQYLLAEVMRRLRLRPILIEALKEAVGLNGLFECPNPALGAYPAPKRRLGDIQLRVIGIRRGYLVFEVLPTPPPKPTPAALPEDGWKNRSEEAAEIFSALPF